jgi:hypothetical protein
MTTGGLRRARLGALIVSAGLLVQAGSAFLWSPGAFILSAAVGVPLVGVGAIVAWLGIRNIGRGEG